MKITAAVTREKAQPFSIEELEIEEHTDAMEQPLIEAIGDDFETLVAQLNGWAELCIKVGAFPPSIQKRAAG